MTSATLIGLKRKRPEWAPWLAVVEEAVRDAAGPDWESTVPSEVAPQQDGVPIAAGVKVSVRDRSVRGLFERLIRVASSAGTPEMALTPALRPDLDVLRLFQVSLRHDGGHVKHVAAAAGVDAEALQAVVALLAIPLLQACHRRWASLVNRSWAQGYCPICAGWPAFAEMRGIERRRYLRCGRCGAAWQAPALHCPYCRENDHHELMELVPQAGASHGVVCACASCGGFVKTLTVLQGCPPSAVMLEDLASVDLDVAAIEHGYARPAGLGYPLEIAISENSHRRSFLTWRR